MCGIFGFSSKKDINSQAILDQMKKLLEHRGPDDFGTYTDEKFCIGNVLLTIVDIGNSHQPFIKEWRGEKYICVYNGEIYNYRNLRNELKKLGMVFKTDCDTEVVVAAFAAWGEKALERFDGQWAVAIWCVNRKRLFLSRDPFGIKPLFYWHSNGGFGFASEPKALFAHPDIVKRPNLDAIAEYFLHGYAFASGYATSSRSFYEGVHSVPPGNYLLWEKGKALKIKNYFQLPLGNEFLPYEISDVVKTLRSRVEESVCGCLMGDVPVGVALSGGVDSSIITAVAAREMQRNSMSPLLASCITYDGQMHNEDAEHARLLADSLANTYPINLVYSRLNSEHYLDDLDRMIRHFDEPHWEIKQLAMFYNYRTLKQNGAKIVLTGEGADELFLGYYHEFPGFRNPEISSADTLRDLWGKRIPFVDSLLAGNTEERLHYLMDIAIDKFYIPYAVNKVDSARCMQGWYLHTFLHWLLIDNDRCSMAHSLEGRFPYLNRLVFEVALRIPTSLQIGDEHGREKLLLREAFKSILPEMIWKKRKKAPLPSPTKLSFHEIISRAFEQAVAEVPNDIWNVIDKKRVVELVADYEKAIHSLSKNGGSEAGGNHLTQYLSLHETWQLRTPHMFGLLTLLRWWTLNFS